MNEPEFEEFGLSWRDETPVEETQVFQQLARRASRRGRLLLYAELAFGAFAVAAGLAAIIVYRATWTTAVAATLIALITWYAWRHYRLNSIRILVADVDRDTMLASAAAAVSARLRSSTIGLALLLPSWILGIAFKGLVEFDGDIHAFLSSLAPSLANTRPLAAVAALVLIGGWFGRQNFRLRKELRSIESLRREYQAEALLDRSADKDS